MKRKIENEADDDELPAKKRKLNLPEGLDCNNVSEEKSEKSEEEEMEEEDEGPLVNFITAHLDDSAVIWTSDPNEIPLRSGKFCIGWKVDEIDPTDEKDEEKETMFVIQNAIHSIQVEKKEQNQELLSKAADLVNKADVVIVIAGAGIGCDSNLPDYRSANGFWKAYPPLVKANLSLKEMSRSSWFKDDPSLAWGFYSHRQQLYESAKPHEGFRILHEFCSKAEDYFIITSNVDSQFQKFGFPEAKVFETHGSLKYLQCCSCCCDSVWVDKNVNRGKPLEVEQETFKVKNKEEIPNCKKCKGTARPNVSFFTDTPETFVSKRQEKQKELAKEFLEELKKDSKKRVLVMEIGCGTSIHSLRFESELLLYHFEEFKNRISFVRINPTHHIVEERSGFVGLPMTALDGLRAIEEQMKKENGKDEKK